MTDYRTFHIVSKFHTVSFGPSLSLSDNTSKQHAMRQEGTAAAADKEEDNSTQVTDGGEGQPTSSSGVKQNITDKEEQTQLLVVSASYLPGRSVLQP
jgi:hypothetical protein